jgi:hypothetical protein
MRAFTKIAVATAVAGGLSIAGAGVALADPPPEEAASDAVGAVEGSPEEAVAAPGEPSEEALALLEDEDVVELLNDPAVVELLGDEAVVEALGALVAEEGPQEPAEAPGAPDAPDAPAEAPEAPVGGAEDATGALP